MATKEQPVGTLLISLLGGELGHISKRVLPEDYLQDLALHAYNERRLSELIRSLVTSLVNQYDRNLDWNSGSIMQHAAPEAVIPLLNDDDLPRTRLYELIGLTWALGEFRRRDQRVIDFLQDTVVHTTNSESWWRAAFALQKLDIVDAVSYLKSALRARAVPSLEECLSDVGNERYRVGVLLHCKLDDLHAKILPRLKEVLCNRASTPAEHIGAAWLIGRLKYLDPEIEGALYRLIHSHNYEITYGVADALREIRSPHFLKEFEHLLEHRDPLLRKIAAHALGQIDEPESLDILEGRLLAEEKGEVVSAITRAMYDLKHHAHRETAFLRRTIRANENGMITDEADKWYLNPDIYHIFSENQDPENLCFRLAFGRLHGHSGICNPIDLGSGTGRLAWFILEHIPYAGTLHCIDNSKQMVLFLDQRRKRESIPKQRVSVYHGAIANLATIVGEEASNLVVANFAFPSKITNLKRCAAEVKAVAHTLQPGGHLITFGWDEMFNDELSELWYKFVPDRITARSFEEWRQKRVAQIRNARNCGLTWFKQGLRVPLEFSSVEVAARVMGYLFGRSAGDEVLRTRRTAWSINVGITIDTKEGLENLLRESS